MGTGVDCVRSLKHFSFKFLACVYIVVLFESYKYVIYPK